MAETPVPLPSEEKKLSTEERILMQKILSNPLYFPKEFKTWLNDYLAVNIPLIPISQILGFSTFSASISTTTASFATTSNTYVTSSSGPSISAIPNGKYIFIYGTLATNSTLDKINYFSPSVNSAVPSDNNAAIWGTNPTNIHHGVTYCFLSTLSSSNNNRIDMEYRVDGGTGNWKSRWLALIKYSDL